MLSDLRYAIRSLAKSPGFTATALLTLALCIGANIAIFAIVDAILIRPLPFPESDRIVITSNLYPAAGVARDGSSSLANYYDRRNAIKAFSSVSVRQSGSALIGGEGAPQRVARDRISPEFFSTLGVSLAMGRTFIEEELAQGKGNVAILTDDFWRSQFNAAPDILGRTFLMNGNTMTVVGILPPRFLYLSTNNTPRIYIPAASRPDDYAPNQRHSNNYQLIARLAPGATIQSAQSEIDVFNAQLLTTDPVADVVKKAGFITRVESLHHSLVTDVRPMLILLQAGVACLLIIGGVNLVNLLLIRASGRAKELVIRQALGASHWHIAQQTLIEILLLALTGGLMGIFLGSLAIDLMSLFGTDRLPLGSNVSMDTRVAMAALIGSLVVGLGLAIPVIWINLRSKLALGLQSESRGGTASPAAQRLRHYFIIGQIALSFTLLVGAGLLGLSFKRVLATSPGFQSEHVLTGSINLAGKEYSTPASRLAYIDRLLTDLRAQPGVTAVGTSNMLPFGGGNNNNVIAVEGSVQGPKESLRTHYTSMAMGDYWQALGIPLIEGRFLEDADHHREQKVCVVDQDFARQYWPGQSALGRRLTRGPSFDPNNAFTIVGVVSSVKQSDLADTGARGAVQQCFRPNESSNFHVIVRTTMDPAAFGPALRQAVLRTDPQNPISDLRTMSDRLDASLLTRRSPAALAGLFAGVALLLTSIGTYGVLAYAVNQRRREIGVRMALGAMPRQVLALFLSMGGKLLSFGLGFGVLGAWLGGRLMQSQLYQVSPAHLGILSATAALLAASVFLAIYLPARRATKVNPVEALRAE